MAMPLISPWKREEIPDEDMLFMRVHKNHIQPDGNILLIAFRNHGDPGNPSREPGMSTACRQRGKDPDKYEVITLQVGKVREIPDQRVDHTPIYEPPILNRAHTDVYGEKDEEARLTLFQISTPMSFSV